MPAHTLEIQVLNSVGTILGNGCAPLNNNKNTVVTRSALNLATSASRLSIGIEHVLQIIQVVLAVVVIADQVPD
jgi:hypothetical protein